MLNKVSQLFEAPDSQSPLWPLGFLGFPNILGRHAADATKIIWERKNLNKLVKINVCLPDVFGNLNNLKKYSVTGNVCKLVT
jgi:hypothetical protein